MLLLLLLLVMMMMLCQLLVMLQLLQVLLLLLLLQQLLVCQVYGSIRIFQHLQIGNGGEHVIIGAGTIVVALILQRVVYDVIDAGCCCCVSNNRIGIGGSLGCCHSNNMLLQLMMLLGARRCATATAAVDAVKREIVTHYGIRAAAAVVDVAEMLLVEMLRMRVIREVRQQVL